MLGVTADAPPLADPSLQGFVNSYFASAAPPTEPEPARPSQLHRLPELALFCDWETTLLLSPCQLTSTKTSHYFYSVQYARLIHRYRQYESSIL